jgi:hypothetical protein
LIRSVGCITRKAQDIPAQLRQVVGKHFHPTYFLADLDVMYNKYMAQAGLHLTHLRDKVNLRHKPGNRLSGCHWKTVLAQRQPPATRALLQQRQQIGKQSLICCPGVYQIRAAGECWARAESKNKSRAACGVIAQLSFSGYRQQKTGRFFARLQVQGYYAGGLWISLP